MNTVIIFFSFIVVIWAVPVAQKIPLPIPRHNIHKNEHSFGNSRIIGGSVAKKGQFPWQVAIYFDSESGSFFCSGALIELQWVLTSARCVSEASSFTLLLGTTSLSTGGVVKEANYSITHPDFNPITLENDVGLIRIDDIVQQTGDIQPISITSSELKSEVSVTASGFGSTGGGGISDPLYYINLKTISNSECKFSYGMLIPEEMVCAMGNRNNGICTGDSGDPLVMEDSNGKMIHVGVASWSSASGCLTSQPSGFSRTASYYGWIKSVI